MKKIISLLLIVCLAAACIGCGAKAEPVEETQTSAEAQEPVQQSAATDEPQKLTTIGVSEDPSAVQTSQQTIEQPASETSDTSMVVETRGYKVEFLRAEKGKDYAGTDVAVVYYRFTNSNSDGTGFWTVCADSARQNGMLLDAGSLVLDYAADVAPSNQLVSNGESVEVKCMYPVQNFSSPINLSVAIYDASGYNVETSGGCTITLG